MIVTWTGCKRSSAASIRRRSVVWPICSTRPGRTAASSSSSATAARPARASHLGEDLGKGCLPQADLRDESKRRLKVLSLTDNVGWLTALGNDCGYDQIFVQQLMNYGQPGDLVIAISGSGNSPNVLAAVDWANRHGLKTFGMTGYNGGKLKQMQQAGIHVPLDDMGMVESIHGCLMHWVIDDLYGRINGCGRYGK